MQFQKIRYFIDNHFQLHVTYFIIMNVKTIYNLLILMLLYYILKIILYFLIIKYVHDKFDGLIVWKVKKQKMIHMK